jgi:adenylosuccinate synthase
MSVWVVVGGQYGSEGKGKIAAFIALQEQIDICVRCGGPNSGHCFVDESGEFRSLRQIPTGYVRPETRLLIPSGGLIDLEVLRRELEVLRLGPDRVGLDRRAMVIEESDREAEQGLGLRERLSSTLCGVGSAVSRRVLRGEGVRLAQDAAAQTTWLRPYLVDVSAEINYGIDHGKKVLVEGTQGFGLSLYHSEAYPKATSRDTSAAGCISECGISPRLVTEVVLVLRTFPIRVAGQQAGPMFEEIDWETIQRESGYPHPIAEYTTVTGKLRRVGRFDVCLARHAVAINRPTRLALNFLDYVSARNREAALGQPLTTKTVALIGRLEEELGVSVNYGGVSPQINETLTFPGFQRFAFRQELIHLRGPNESRRNTQSEVA